jgi:hypothetical protein
MWAIGESAGFLFLRLQLLMATGTQKSKFHIEFQPGLPPHSSCAKSAVLQSQRNSGSRITQCLSVAGNFRHGVNGEDRFDSD